MDLMTWTQGIYVLTSIFGLGVTAIDMLGILGGDDGEGDADLGGAEGIDLDIDELDLDHGMTEAPFGQGADGPAAATGAADGALDHGDLTPVEASSDGSGQSGGVAHGQQATVFATSFIILTYLRRLVYFSLGFGPVGLAAIGTGAGVLTSLAWAVPCGIASAMLAGWIFRFQRRDVDSSVTGRDLFFQRARVLIPISAGGMGKVRVALGQSVVDRYARAKEPQQAFRKGEVVCITRVTKECVYVEPFSPKLPGSGS